LLGFSAVAWSADISVSGTWSRLVTRNDLIAGAGTDIGPVESDSVVATLIVDSPGAESWTVRVKRGSNWPEGLTIEVRRSAGEGGISGGLSYLTLGSAERDFFSGTGDRTVPIQLRVSGLTVHGGAVLQSLTIVYSVDPS
jgi:hypothetical protein